MYYNRRSLRLLLLPVLFGLVLMIPGSQAAAQSGPCLEVAPDSISFYRNICGDGSDWDGLDSHYVMISNCGDTTLVWSITPSEPWIICQPNTGQNIDSVLVFIDPGSIPPAPDPAPGDTVILGAYLTVEAPGADNSPQWVGVTLYQHCVPEDYALAVHPTSFMYTASQNHTFEDWLHVWEVHGENIEFELYNSSGWLTLPLYFTPLTTPDSVPFVVNTDGLVPGVYHDTIAVIALVETSNSPLHVPVTLAVTDSGYVLATDPTSFEFTLSPSDSVVVESLYVYETGGASINFWTHNNSYWLYVDTMSASPLYTPTSIILVVNAGGLSPGVYTDSVFIMAYEAPPIAVPVTLTVEGSGGDYIVEAVPAYFHLSVAEGEAIDTSLHIYEIFGRSVGFNLSNNSDWLQYSTRPMYVTPATLGIVANASNLSPGYYSDTIHIYSAVDTTAFPPVAVPVFLTVHSQMPVVRTVPDHFNFTVSPGHTLSNIGMVVFEETGLSVPFWIQVAGGSSWLQVHPPDSLDPMWETPDSVYFDIVTGDLPPGVYTDTLIVFNPLDNDTLWYEPVLIPVTVMIIGGDYALLSIPASFNFTLSPGDSLIGQLLYIYEASGESFGFWTHNRSDWLYVDTMPASPLVTPDSVFLDVYASTFSPGIYYDTVFVMAYDAAALAVQVTLVVEGEPGDYIVGTAPTWFNLTVEQGGSAFDSLHVFEIHGHSVPFIFYSNEPWLILDPHWDWIPPYFTPMTLMFLVNAAELAPGSYIDTIFIAPEPASDTLMFPPVAVPVHITVHPDWPSVMAVPDHFVLTVPEGGSISNLGMWVYEEHGDTVVFSAHTLNHSNWLQMHDSADVLHFTPDSLYFDIQAGDLMPGVYSDSIVIFNPFDDSVWYDDVYVPVTLIVEGETPEFVVETSPSSFNVTLMMGEFVYDSLHVYEIHGRTVAFDYSNSQYWLTVMAYEIPVYFTPEVFPVLIDTDTLSPGIYRDTILISPGVDSLGFPVVAVPVTMTIVDSNFCGDIDGSHDIDIDDVVCLINYVFYGGFAPLPLSCGDVDCSMNVDIDDIVYLIYYVFSMGPQPCADCT